MQKSLSSNTHFVDFAKKGDIRMSKRCKCGRVLCDLCEEKRASIRMRNKYNGAILNVCADCYQEVWGVEPW